MATSARSVQINQAAGRIQRYPTADYETQEAYASVDDQRSLATIAKRTASPNAAAAARRALRNCGAR